MKMMLESTDRLVEIELDFGVAAGIVPARLWQGRTESGTPCFALIVRVVPEIAPDDPRQAEFERELVECEAPRPAIDDWLHAINSRLIL